MRTAILFAAATLFCGALDASAASRVYRWVDKEGHVHYTDQPPADVPSTAISGGVPTLGSGEAAGGPATATASSGENKAEECQKAKEKLAAYNAASKISETDSLGNVREYSAEERQKLIQLTQAKADAACGAATP